MPSHPYWLLLLPPQNKLRSTDIAIKYNRVINSDKSESSKIKEGEMRHIRGQLWIDKVLFYSLLDNYEEKKEMLSILHHSIPPLPKRKKGMSKLLQECLEHLAYLAADFQSQREEISVESRDFSRGISIFYTTITTTNDARVSSTMSTKWNLADEKKALICVFGPIKPSPFVIITSLCN